MALYFGEIVLVVVSCVCAIVIVIVPCVLSTVGDCAVCIVSLGVML